METRILQRQNRDEDSFFDDMFVSIRKKFRKGDLGWDAYIKFIQLFDLPEVRTIDSALNKYVDGDIPCTPETLSEMMECLLRPKVPDEYHLLALNLDGCFAKYVPEGWTLLGHDLSDETHTSSLLNCGPWEGWLAPFPKRLNAFGLLSQEDATQAQALLPREWGEQEPHAHVVRWALYEKALLPKEPLATQARGE